jgi:hypothetical protein
LPISENISTSNNNGDGLVSSNEPLITALEPLDLPLDSHVTVARPGPDQVLLQDVYRLVTGQSLTVTPPRNWRQMESFPAGPRRDNYGGLLFDTVTVVSIVVNITIIIIVTKDTSSFRCLSTDFGFSCQGYHLERKEISDLDSLPHFPRTPKQYMEAESAARRI